MNKQDVINVANFLFSIGYTRITSIDIIEIYEKIPYVTDRVGWRHQNQGANISKHSGSVPMVKVKTGVRVKDSNGHYTFCAIYERPKNYYTENKKIPQ